MPLPKSRWREGFVEGFGLFGDGGPGEGFDGALAAGVAEGFLFGWVGHDFVDAGGEVVGEFFGIHRFERAFGHLLDGDEVAGFAVDDDFGDAADGAGHDGASAGHGFKVDNAEGFVDGGANEDAGVAVEFDLGFVVEHLVDPDDAVALALGLGDGGFHFGRDLGCVGSAGAEDDLEAGVEVLDGVDEVDDAFLAGDAAEEEGVGFCGVDAEAVEHAVRGDCLVFRRVDAVVDDVEAGGVDLEKLFHIAAGAFGDGDDGVCHFEGGALEPACEVVAAAELLAFPRAEWLERVDGDDEGNAVVQLGEDAAEVGIPGVAVHDTGIDAGGVEIEATLECAEDGLELLRRSPPGRVEAESLGSELACGGILVAEAADIHGH